jgi:Domain of unknown function (DUF4157)
MLPPTVKTVLQSPGQRLDAATQAFMQPFFGRDLSTVRVHSDGEAARSAGAVHARAYTVGHDIVFGPHQFAPSTPAGRRLIAHEIAHFVQQGAGVRYQPLLVLQRDAAGETEAVEPEFPWLQLSPSARQKAGELYDDCVEDINKIEEAQLVRNSLLRSEWLEQLGDVRIKISQLKSDDELPAARSAKNNLFKSIGDHINSFQKEWLEVKKRYDDERQWLLSLKFIDAKESSRYLEEVYRQTQPLPFLMTDDDYLPLKHTLDENEQVRVGALRGTRNRVQQLLQMMHAVVYLRQQGQEAEKALPEWGEQVTGEAEYLASFASLAHREHREYAGELDALRNRLLAEQQFTMKIRVSTKSPLEKGAAAVAGAVEAVTGIFVEAAKEAFDLAQICLHFETHGLYDPKFTSAMAETAEQGAGTTDLLKGMVTGMINTPKRFLQACRDGDWEAIGREAIQLYFLAKTIVAAPELIKGSAEALRKLPEALAKVRDISAILRQRTIALGLKAEGRLGIEPQAGRVPPPKPAPQSSPAFTVEKGGGQGDSRPAGMLRDADAPSGSVQVPASHPRLAGKLPANDELPPLPQRQIQQVAGNASGDVPSATVEPPRAPDQPGQTVMTGKRLPRSQPKQPQKPPAGALDIDEGQLSRKRPRREEAPRKENVSTPNKVPIKNSAWLNRRLGKDPALQDSFLKEVENSHLEVHGHLNPETFEADEQLERWNASQPKPHRLGPRFSRRTARRP